MPSVSEPPPSLSPMRDYGYYRSALADCSLPAAFIDLDCMDDNLRRLCERAQGLPVRLATKSVRSLDMIRMIMASSQAMSGLLAYCADEAAWLASEGFDDIVVAYPTVERAGLSSVAEQIRRGHSITLMVDSLGHVERLDRLAREESVVFPVAIDLDMSSRFPGLHFGMYRSPVNGVESALALAREIGCRRGVTLDGLMGYEGQIAGLPDCVPGQHLKSAIVRLLKRVSIREINARRSAVVAALKAQGHTLRFVNGGGTGSLESTRLDPSVSEVAAGSGLYAPTLFDHYERFRAAPAAGFALPVVRIAQRRIATCLGGGYVASGPAGPSRLPQPWLPAGCELIANEGAGEVQTPVRHPRTIALALGDPIFFRHAKAGELCERFNELLLIRNGRVVQRVKTYRGDGKHFF